MGDWKFLKQREFFAFKNTKSLSLWDPVAFEPHQNVIRSFSDCMPGFLFSKLHTYVFSGRSFQSKPDSQLHCSYYSFKFFFKRLH